MLRMVPLPTFGGEVRVWVGLAPSTTGCAGGPPPPVGEDSNRAGPAV